MKTVWTAPVTALTLLTSSEQAVRPRSST